MADLVLRPAFAQDLHDLVAAFVAVFAVGHFTGKIGADDVQRQPPLQHMIQRRNGARQHDRLHLATADRGEKIDLVGQGRHARDEDSVS